MMYVHSTNFNEISLMNSSCFEFKFAFVFGIRSVDDDTIQHFVLQKKLVFIIIASNLHS